jgi:hypothetical protein
VGSNPIARTKIYFSNFSNALINSIRLFSSVIAIIALLVPLVGFGVSQFWLKAYGFDGWKAQRWLKVSFRFLVLSTLIVISIYTLFVYVVNSDFSIKQVFLWMILFLLGQVVIELVSVRLQLKNDL